MAADQFSIFVLGSDEDGGPAASIGEHSELPGVAGAPHGAISIADHVRTTGALAGFDVVLGYDVDLNFEGGFCRGARSARTAATLRLLQSSRRSFSRRGLGAAIHRCLFIDRFASAKPRRPSKFHPASIRPQEP